MATVSFATGGVREALCPACAERRAGVPGLAGIMNSMVPERKETNECPYCGTTAEKARKTGMAGCPLCYTALADVWPSLGAKPGRYALGKGEDVG